MTAMISSMILRSNCGRSTKWNTDAFLTAMEDENKSRKTLWLSVFYGFFCALGFSADKRNLSFVRPPIQNHTRNSDEVSLIGAQSDTGQATPAAPHPHHHGPWCTTLWVCFFYSKLHSFIYYPASANWIVNEKQTCVYIVCCFQIYPFEIERRTDNTVIIWFFTYFHTRHIMVQLWSNNFISF